MESLLSTINEESYLTEGYETLVLPCRDNKTFKTMSNGIDMLIKKMGIYTNPIMDFVLSGDFEFIISGCMPKLKLDMRTMVYNSRQKCYIYDIEQHFTIPRMTNYGINLSEPHPWELLFTFSGVVKTLI